MNVQQGLKAIRVVATLALGLGLVADAGCSSSSSPSSTEGAEPGSSSGAPGTDAGPGSITSADGSAPSTSPPPDGDAGGPAPSTGATKSGCKYTAHQTGLSAFQQVGGLAFHVYAPSTYDPKVGHTVVFIMHGQDSDGVPELTTLWQPIADAQQLVLVAPRGSRPSTNGDPNVGNWGTADLNSIQDLIGEIDDCYDTFSKKHILWGFSEGAFYGYLLGIGASTQFSGLAMGGANTSFARQSGYPPSAAMWKIPVSDVHGDQDPNPISLTLQDQTDFEAAGHVFTLHENPGGHTITPAQVQMQYDDLKASSSP